ARKRAYCLKIQPATGSFARNLIYSTKPIDGTNILPFQARYIALGQSVAGTANADATFKVQYL
ncbi:fimbrial protein, partial [Escherichia coli]|uniref:fimbrial protein n=1 Tax=Escherichia coli TaxID=562 RepID=UPI00399AF208